MNKLIDAEKHHDERGILLSFNTLNLTEVKRFYIIEQPKNIVRAWQGHKFEQKWFQVLAGSFKVVLIKPDCFENPFGILKLEEYILSAAHPQVLHIKGGYFNGFKALEANSKLMVFSDFNLEESTNDSFRVAKDSWYNW